MTTKDGLGSAVTVIEVKAVLACDEIDEHLVNSSLPGAETLDNTTAPKETICGIPSFW